MKIKIPDINGNETYIENMQSIVLIGANGSGKTRMSIWIEEHNECEKFHRISAQKSLNMPSLVRPTKFDEAEENFLYGTTNKDKSWLKSYGKNNFRWGKQPEIHLLNDFDSLMELLMTEDYQKSIEYRDKHKCGDVLFNNTTRLEQIKTIWQDVILHRELKVSTGKIEVVNTKNENQTDSDYYNGSQMSDGERAIFYFIGEILSAPHESIIIVDEPENHLHKSILIRLWNSIEMSRSDCTFIYITHTSHFKKCL